MKSISIVLLVLLMLVGCATPKTQPPPVRALSTLQIFQSFEALPNYTRLYFQNGSVLEQKSLDRWAVYCALYLYNPAAGAGHQIDVNPGNLQVIRVDKRVESSDYSLSKLGDHTLPGMGILPLPDFRNTTWQPRQVMTREQDGPPDFYLYQVELTLQAVNQPDIRSLTCFNRWGSRGKHYPTLEEIRNSLGSIVKIRPPAMSSSI